MRVILLALFSLLLTSCAAPLIISSRRCKTNGLWTLPKGEPNSTFTMKVWTGVSGEKLELLDVFEAHKMKCEEVGGLQVLVTQSTSDFFMSLIPFVSRKSVTFNFYSRPVVMEEDSVSADN